MNIPIWIKLEYVTYIGIPSFFRPEGKPPLALWFSHIGIIAYPPHCIQHLFSTPNTLLYSDKANQDGDKTITVIKEIMDGDILDYKNANFVAETPMGSQNLCGCGFHNAGMSGGFLFFGKTDGHLHFKTGANTYTIPFLEELKW